MYCRLDSSFTPTVAGCVWRFYDYNIQYTGISKGMLLLTDVPVVIQTRVRELVRV